MHKLYTRLYHLLVLILACVLSSLSLAQSTLPYKARVTVDAPADDVASPVVTQALQDVLIKVSGRSDVNDNEHITEKLPMAKKFMQQYAYEESPDGKYVLSIIFDAKQIDQLLKEAKLPVWKAERPLIITWIAVESKNGERELITNDSLNQLPTVIQQAAQQRALPIILPLVDLQGINAVSVDDVWLPRPANIQHASERYHSDAILIARVIEDPDSNKLRWGAEWMLWMNGARVDWDNRADTLEHALAEGIGGIANALSSRFAAQAANEEGEHLVLAIHGISDVASYSNISHYLANLQAVTDLQVDTISTDEVIFKLAIQGGEGVLTDALSKDHMLSPIDFYNQKTQLATAQLNYQFVG